MYDKAYANALVEFGIDNGNFPSKLYKFRQIDKRTIDIIKNLEFYFSSPSKFNDPFDCNLFYKKEYSKEEIKNTYLSFIQRKSEMTLKEMECKIGYKSEDFYNNYLKTNQTMVLNTGIFSLSKSYKNITMWSHYSDNHKGLVFELDVKKDLSFFNLFGPVEYEDEYEVLSFAKDNEEELKKLFLTKYTDWKYEKEVRIIDFNKYGCKKFHKDTIKSILFGCKSTNEDIVKIIELCIENGLEHVIFKKAKLIPGKFALDFDEIKKEDFL